MLGGSRKPVAKGSTGRLEMASLVSDCCRVPRNIRGAPGRRASKRVAPKGCHVRHGPVQRIGRVRIIMFRQQKSTLRDRRGTHGAKLPIEIPSKPERGLTEDPLDRADAPPASQRVRT